MSVRVRSMFVGLFLMGSFGSGLLAIGPAEGPAAVAEAAARKPDYPTADIVVQYRDEAGKVVRAEQEFRVDDAEVVAQLAAHLPGILAKRGTGSRSSAGKKTTLTIKFNHQSGDNGELRVAHITPDYSTWRWRDNTPYTGDRQVAEPDQLQTLLARLAAKNKVDVK